MKVQKFGGAAADSVEAISRLLEIAASSGDDILVVSAFGGITDQLVLAGSLAERRGDYRRILDEIAAFHRNIAESLLSAGYKEAVMADIDTMIGELSNLLHGVELLVDLTRKSLDSIMSVGERLAASIVAAGLNSRGITSVAVDSRAFIKTDSNFGNARYLPAETAEFVTARFSALDAKAVVTGFIGSTLEGMTTTLGRGGSNTSASILASCLNAEEIVLWTSVDGMYTADPVYVPDAFAIQEISYDEVLELTHFGAKVLDPPALKPAMKAGIPLRIRNAAKPEAAGTLVCRAPRKSAYPVKGVASIPSISLLSLEGLGMPGSAGIAGRMFSALARAKINVILITQASSEFSICCAIKPDDAAEGKRVLREEFAMEIAEGLIMEPMVESRLCVIAVVGEQMKQRTGIAGRVFAALGRNGINVVAIAQGSSELNISIVTKTDLRGKALNVIHDAFFLSGIRTVNLFLVGAGLIGSTLLSQIAEQRQRLLKEHSIRINLVGLANSRKMIIEPSGIPANEWKKSLEQGDAADLPKFVERMKSLNLPSACFCDCTATDATGAFYRSIMESSISVVTPNKRANAGPFERYREIKDAARVMDVDYGYETTVGAGLPVIGTLRDLVACGDSISRIEAVLSGTVSFIFNNLGRGKSFSALVLEAKERGFTEPDPRDDLGAVDIMRKTLILIREAGLALDQKDIAIQPLLPEKLVKAPSVPEFLAMLPEADVMIDKLVNAAASRGKVLRYVATIEPGSAGLTLREYGPESPFYNLDGTDNIVMFTTARYSSNPLVIRGPGAGAAVTAGGVFADILKTAQSYL